MLDFLRPEAITTCLDAASMDHAIAQLAQLLVGAGGVPAQTLGEVIESACRREAQVSTCFGGGLAVPHAVIERGHEIRGAMGLSREGLRLWTPDGIPVHCVVLLVTPASCRDAHLRALAELAQVIGTCPPVQEQLARAAHPAEAWSVLDRACAGFPAQEPGRGPATAF
jgi:mannitol/fructose-specific phosphotransferase system IIA component (Ntr-type)